MRALRMLAAIFSLGIEFFVDDSRRRERERLREARRFVDGRAWEESMRRLEQERHGG